MADDLPVCDVLCEAMEYLSKLGSNLRTRSDILKEKRIRRDKLKNAHAVKKAANKVLLICELSKKSLENVETGVKKLLNLVGASQSRPGPLGGKNARRESETERKPSLKREVHYFEYQSQKLKVAKKVSLKHFTSVKVMATKMPKLWLDKYPVYHDCKLYRLRMKQASNEIVDELKESDSPSSSKEDIDEDGRSCHKHKSTSSETEKNEDTSDSVRVNQNEKGDDCHLPVIMPGAHQKKNEMDINQKDSNLDKRESNEHKNDQDKKNSETNCKSEEYKKSDLKRQSSEDSESSRERQRSKERERSKSRSQSEDKQKESKGESKTKRIGPGAHDKSKDERKKSSKKHQRTDRKERESFDSERNKDKRKQNRGRSKINLISDDDDEDVKPHKNLGDSSDNSDQELTRPRKKHRRLKILDDSSENSENESNIDTKSKTNTENLAVIKASNSENTQLVSSKNLIESDENDLVDDLKEPKTVDSADDGSKNCETDTKPLIKCVSLSRLLKPDVLEKVVDKTIKDNNKTAGKKNNGTIELSKKKNREEEEAFWALKRKEVKAFKAKQFYINVIKMPNFSQDFLNIHGLKKITQNNLVLFEVPQTTLEEDKEMGPDLINENNSESKNTDTDAVEPAVLDEFKNALLNDTDSEKSQDSPANLVNESENAKSTLLHDSDSDNHIESNKQTSTENIAGETDLVPNKDQEISEVDNQESLPVEREKTPEKGSEMILTDTDLAKSLLLDNSTPTTPSNPMEKPRKKSSSVTPSKRKHIMESMHAKKMLLTYSSSSEADDDEQLKTVVKEVQQQLLKASSDEEVAASQELVSRKKRLTSSDSESDGELLRRAKKKKKLNSISDNSDDDCQKDENSHQNDQDGLNSQNGCDTNKQQENSTPSDDLQGSLNSQGLSEVGPEDVETNCQADVSETQRDPNKMGRSREKQGSSSNSDASDDKDIDGLTNLKTLTQSRRRRGAPKKMETSPKRTNAKTIAKAMFADDGLLDAPLSSDDGSDAGSNDVEEDLPPVSMAALNGSGGIEHLAKDDLLGDSDSDDSNKNKDDDHESEDVKKEENSDDSDDVKSRRRKGNTISSDSEPGSSRRRRADNKLSDFDYSDGEADSDADKKKRKKKKASDSESGGSSTDGKKKKKRRRIKSVNESDASGSDSGNEGKNKHGRKNIRKVMGKNQLEEATKKAAREERERMARIIERQKMYNNMEFDESGKPDEVVLDKVVLDFDPETKEPLIEVDRGLVKKLKPHQANGIKFMWDACFESVKRIKKDKGSGCILAHCMGLGKTLQVVSLTHTLLTHSELTGVNRVLVVCPLSTVLNWVNEFRMWLEHSETDYEVDVYELSRYKQNSERAFQLSQWFKHGGVCVLGYEMFRNLSADNPKKFKKKMLKQFQESLVDPGPDMVVCDEGHLLKNEKTSLSQSMNRVRTRRRMVLTGTPLQNNLKEYYCMVQFVKPNLLGKYNEYLNRFVNPITNGQYTDSTEYDIKIMKRRSHVLHKMLDGAVQRRDYGVLAPFLPPKHEYVLFITLSDVQAKLYQHYLENYSRRPLAGKSSGFLFPDFQSLQRIWTHPLVLKYNSERYEIMQQKKRDKEEEDSEGSLVDFIDDDSTPDETSSEESFDDMSDASDDSRKKSKKKKAGKKAKAKESRANSRRATRANPELEDEEAKLPELPAEVKSENPTEWWIPLVTDDELEDMRHSHKLVLLFEILRQCEAIGDKLLVFSQSLYSLDLIEHFLGKVDEATQEGRVDDKLGGHVGSWSPGIDYFRLDGSTSCENRSIWCKNFNREDNPRARLFLISTRAGGLGINLVAANRVIIFDVSWNPSHDVQSIFRVYRFGQKKPCYVYRFLAMGTMEEKIYERQVTKQAISKRVIDEQQIDRHYAENDLAELYNFEPKPPVPRPVPLVPKDRLFAEMLKEHEALIYKFHEHDSLLENKEEETLSEEERKAAWEDFENEKNRPPPAPFPNWPMHDGLMPNLLAQQQQQLAFAALGSVLRKDMPNLTEDQIRSMIPMIYGANPALMQKLNDMYKYAQPGMMNPAMMNPVMNPGGVGMGGGSSGLQYEPPWQRQQQAQQQMRLQQLMQQQQNQMGAKLYAGGLGSRDPVAMALQQQRAREIMLGERGRPRGRPPGPSARMPATTAGDVVNLDSD